MNIHLDEVEVNTRYSPMLIAPEANNCFSVIFRGEYQELQNNRLKHKNRHNCSCACMYAAIVLMISLHVQQLRINLLIEFSSKTNERNTTESKLIWLNNCFKPPDISHSNLTTVSSCKRAS